MFACHCLLSFILRCPLLLLDSYILRNLMHGSPLLLEGSASVPAAQLGLGAANILLSQRHCLINSLH